MLSLSRLFKTPSILMLSLALLCSVCVVGCSQPDGGDTTPPADTSAGGDDGEGASGGGDDGDGGSSSEE